MTMTDCTASTETPRTVQLLLALLFEAPDGHYVDNARAAADAVRAESTEVAESLERFALSIAPLAKDELDEIFLRTFSVAPSCVAYVGVHLYGEGSFKRGELLALLANGFEQRGFKPLDNELPDQIGVLLRFADRLAWLAREGDATAQDELDDLELWLMAVPTRVMVETLRDTGNPYFELLSAVSTLVARGGIPEEVVAAVAVQGQQASDPGCSFCSETKGDLLTGDPLDAEPVVAAQPDLNQPRPGQDRPQPDQQA